jgi:hypothetical protein
MLQPPPYSALSRTTPIAWAADPFQTTSPFVGHGIQNTPQYIPAEPPPSYSPPNQVSVAWRDQEQPEPPPVGAPWIVDSRRRCSRRHHPTVAVVNANGITSHKIESFSGQILLGAYVLICWNPPIGLIAVALAGKYSLYS